MPTIVTMGDTGQLPVSNGGVCPQRFPQEQHRNRYAQYSGFCERCIPTYGEEATGVLRQVREEEYQYLCNYEVREYAPHRSVESLVDLRELRRE